MIILNDRFDTTHVATHVGNNISETYPRRIWQGLDYASCILRSMLSSLMGLPNPAWVSLGNVVSHMGCYYLLYHLATLLQKIVATHVGNTNGAISRPPTWGVQVSTREYTNVGNVAHFFYIISSWHMKLKNDLKAMWSIPGFENSRMFGHDT